jgi:hypothetical protein
MLADAAVAPPPAAAASATAATSAAAASAASAAAPAAAAAAASMMATATPGELDPRRSRLLLVEHVKCAEVDVRDLFLVQGDLLAGQRDFVLRRNVRNCRVCRGGTTRQRQRYANQSENGYGFLPARSLRSLLPLWHARPPCPANEDLCLTCRCSSPVRILVRFAAMACNNYAKVLTLSFVSVPEHPFMNDKVRACERQHSDRHTTLMCCMQFRRTQRTP